MGESSVADMDINTAKLSNISRRQEFAYRWITDGHGNPRLRNYAIILKTQLVAEFHFCQIDGTPMIDNDFRQVCNKEKLVGFPFTLPLPVYEV